MTTHEILLGLSRVQRLADAGAKLIARAIEEIGNDEHANWGEAEASVALALGELLPLGATLSEMPAPDGLTLRDILHELARRAVDAADPDKNDLQHRLANVDPDISHDEALKLTNCRCIAELVPQTDDGGKSYIVPPEIAEGLFGPAVEPDDDAETVRLRRQRRDGDDR